MPRDITDTNSDKPIGSQKPLNTAELPIESSKVTIGGIWRALSRLSLKTCLALLMSFGVYTSAIFTFGYLVSMRETGITLNHPFDMRISITEKDLPPFVQSLPTTHSFRLHKLILTNFSYKKKEEKKCLKIFQEVEPLYDKEVGQIECLVHQTSISEAIKDILFGLNHRILGDIAFAQNISLGPHKNDNNYKQSFVDPQTIRRTYKDGCVLQFKIDKKGASIPASYVWIVYKH